VVPTAAESVHLSDFPRATPGLAEPELVEAMAVAQQIVALGRAARDAAALRVRQPLARMYVTLPRLVPREDVLRLRDVILEELNVKELEFAGSEDAFVSYTVKPNLPVLGPRFGRRLPQIRAALDALDAAAVVAAVEQGKHVPVVLDGEEVLLSPEDLLTSARRREGYAAMAADGFVVALDTHLTPELVREGMAREVARRINEWRKAAGFNIEDRIVVHYQATGELDLALREYAEYVKEQTLALELAPGLTGDAEYVGEAAFGGQQLTVGLGRSHLTGAA
jgi:isoleucyl-tRNA synthetase